MWQPVTQPLLSLTHAHQGPPLTAVHPRGSQETPAEGTRRRCALGLAVGRGAPAAALAPLLGLWAGWLPQQPVPTPGAHPGLQALPEQQDISWPECPWKEAAYQRGKDTLFRPGHLPRLGGGVFGAWRGGQGTDSGRVPASGLGQEVWGGRMCQLHAPGSARTLALPEMRSGPSFPFTVLPSLHARPTSPSPGGALHSLHSFI